MHRFAVFSFLYLGDPIPLARNLTVESIHLDSTRKRFEKASKTRNPFYPARVTFRANLNSFQSEEFVSEIFAGSRCFPLGCDSLPFRPIVFVSMEVCRHLNFSEENAWFLMYRHLYAAACRRCILCTWSTVN